MIRQILFRISTIGVGTTVIGFGSKGKRLGSTMNTTMRSEIYSQGTDRVVDQ
jgi:hypothetical protein